MSLKGGESELHPMLVAAASASGAKTAEGLGEVPRVLIDAAHYISPRGRKVSRDMAVPTATTLAKLWVSS